MDNYFYINKDNGMINNTNNSGNNKINSVNKPGYGWIKNNKNCCAKNDCKCNKNKKV